MPTTRRPRTVQMKEGSEPARIFVRQYVINQNATKAYIEAGGSPNGADRSGPKVLKRPYIQKAIAAERKRIAEETKELNPEYILRKTKHIIDADISEFYCEDGTLKSISEWPSEVIIAVERFVRDKETGKIVDVVFKDWYKAADMINKIKGFYQPQEIKVNEDALENLAKALDNE